MARHEADREDLIREATALKDRIEWDVPGEPEPVVAGLKSNGGLSLYFGQDPVYHFDADGGLRRAYVAGFLYRTQGGTLARMHRERSATETALMRHDLDSTELTGFLAAMTDQVTRLRAALADGGARELRRVCEVANPDFPGSLETVLRAEKPLAPAIPTRK